MKKDIVILILVIVTLVLIVVGIDVVVNKNQNSISQDNENLDKPPNMPYPNDYCDKLRDEFIQLIDKANYCVLDSDCIFVKGIRVCGALINRNVDLKKIREKDIEEHQKCPYEKGCNLFPNQEDIKCENNKCVRI